MDNPALSLRPHYRTFTATTNLSASAPGDGTQSLAVPPLGKLPLPCRNEQGVSGHAFSCSTRKPQTRLTSSTCRTPPGQKTAHPPGLSLDPFDTPVSMSPVSVSTRQQRFTRVRRPGPYQPPLGRLSSSLTTTVFSQRSMRWFGASHRRAAPKGQHPSSSVQHRFGNSTYRTSSTFRTHQTADMAERQCHQPPFRHPVAYPVRPAGRAAPTTEHQRLASPLVRLR